MLRTNCFREALLRACVRKQLYSSQIPVTTEGSKSLDAPPQRPTHVYVKSTNKLYPINYKGIIEEEFNWDQYTDWARKGYVTQDGKPKYRFFGSPFRPINANTKIWQMEMQKANGKPVWEKGPQDVFINFVVGMLFLFMIPMIGYNLYWVVVPEKKQNWGWSGFKEQKAFQRASDNH